jgi:hypothetical protein
MPSSLSSSMPVMLAVTIRRNRTITEVTALAGLSDGFTLSKPFYAHSGC